MKKAVLSHSGWKFSLGGNPQSRKGLDGTTVMQVLWIPDLWKTQSISPVKWEFLLLFFFF